MLCYTLLKREGWKKGGRRRTVSITVIIDITTVTKLLWFPNCPVPLCSQLVDLL